LNVLIVDRMREETPRYPSVRTPTLLIVSLIVCLSQCSLSLSEITRIDSPLFILSGIETERPFHPRYAPDRRSVGSSRATTKQLIAGCIFRLNQERNYACFLRSGSVVLGCIHTCKGKTARMIYTTMHATSENHEMSAGKMLERRAAIL
jgi:hypothetical protein